MFDIIIPVGPNDYDIIKNSIEYTKKNVINYRNIYIISKNKMEFSECIYINEDIFPFNLDNIGERMGCKERAGWYIQQLIKLTATKYIEGILDNYLVIDADVYFLKPTEFIKDNKPLFTFGDEHHIPYFDHMLRLHPDLTRQKDMSGICHHMMFNKIYINELFKLVEEYKQKSFIDVFIDEVTLKGPGISGASEYEIYFNFMIKYHFDKIIIRELKWKNIRHLSEINNNYDYVAYHHYSRLN
jgi:hypothetical protein